jgi:hypothetical protein
MGRTKDLFIEQREYEYQKEQEDLQRMQSDDLHIRPRAVSKMLPAVQRRNEGKAKEKA